MAPLSTPAIVPTPPVLFAPPPVTQFGGSGGDGFTWHLSVINAGQPRGDSPADAAGSNT